MPINNQKELRLLRMQRPSAASFEQTATGSGATYSTGGTLWVDMVTITGDVLDRDNTAPHHFRNPAADRAREHRYCAGRFLNDSPAPERTWVVARHAQTDLPDLIETEAELEQVLTRPAARLIEFVQTLSSPLVILGAGGKMGPTLAVLAKRAALEAKHDLEVIAVSRFGDKAAREWLEERGVKTASADLLERDSELPEAENVIYLVGLKFGTSQNPAATWVMNTIVPANVAERYARARIVALSTGNVYPNTDFTCGGAVESNPLTPLGEYPNAAVARERIFEFYAGRNQTRLALMRLFYAVEPRYGVLVDIGQKVFRGEAIPLANGYFNCIWQGDANEMIIRALDLAGSPPSAWNLCKPQFFSVRQIASQLGEIFGRKPRFEGTESQTALLGNPQKLCAALGEPCTEMRQMLTWIGHWIKLGGRDLGRPTHFEVRDGAY